MNNAISRAEESGLNLSALTGAAYESDQSQKISYQGLKQNAENLFGVNFSLYNASNISNPNTNCNAILQNPSAKHSLVQSVAAMIHVVSRFKEMGLSRPIDLFRTHLGVTYQFNDARQPDGAGFTPEVNPDQLFLGWNNSYVPATLTKAAYNTGIYVAVSTIVHELGHAFDRHFSYRPDLPLVGLFVRRNNGPTYNSTDRDNLQAMLNGAGGVVSRTATSDIGDRKEVWADMFMTYVFEDYNKSHPRQRVNTFNGGRIDWQSGRVGEFGRSYTEFAINCLMGGQCGNVNFPPSGTSPAPNADPVQNSDDPYIQLVTHIYGQ